MCCIEIKSVYVYHSLIISTVGKVSLWKWTAFLAESTKNSSLKTKNLEVKDKLNKYTSVVLFGVIPFKIYPQEDR